MSIKRMLGAVALLAIVLRPGAAARTGVCTDVSASVPSGSCANTTLPFRACVPDDTSLANFTQKLATDLQTSVTYRMFDTATCPTMTNFTKIGCEKQGGNIRTGICDAGGPYCSNILVSVIDQYACRREDDATCTLPELGSFAPARLSCCESLKTVTLSQCDLTGVTVDWETQAATSKAANECTDTNCVYYPPSAADAAASAVVTTAAAAIAVVTTAAAAIASTPSPTPILCAGWPTSVVATAQAALQKDKQTRKETDTNALQLFLDHRVRVTTTLDAQCLALVESAKKALPDSSAGRCVVGLLIPVLVLSLHLPSLL